MYVLYIRFAVISFVCFCRRSGIYLLKQKNFVYKIHPNAKCFSFFLLNDGDMVLHKFSNYKVFCKWKLLKVFVCICYLSSIILFKSFPYIHECVPCFVLTVYISCSNHRLKLLVLLMKIVYILCFRYLIKILLPQNKIVCS